MMELPAGTEVEARHLRKRHRWRRAVLQEEITTDTTRVKIKYVGETQVHPVPLADLKFSKVPSVKPAPEKQHKPPPVEHPPVEVIDVDSDSVPGSPQTQTVVVGTPPEAWKEKEREPWREWLQQTVESEKMIKARKQEEARRNFTRPRTAPRKSDDKDRAGKPHSLLEALMRQKRTLDGNVDKEKSLYAKVLRVEDRDVGGTKRGHQGEGPHRNAWDSADANSYNHGIASGWRADPVGRPPEGGRAQQEEMESWDVKRRRMGNANRESFIPHNSNARNAVDDAPIERHPVRVAAEDLPYRIPRRHTSYDGYMGRFSYAPPPWAPPGQRTEEFRRRDKFRPPIDFEETEGFDSGDAASLPAEPVAARSQGEGNGASPSASARDVTEERTEQSEMSDVPQPKPKEQARKRPPASRVATRYRPSGSPFLGTIDCGEEDTKILELCEDMLNGGQLSSAEEELEGASVQNEVTVRGKGRKSTKPRRWCRPFVMQRQESYARPESRKQDKTSIESTPQAPNKSFNSAIRSRCRAFGGKGFSTPFLVDCVCGESDLNADDREDAVQCRVCGLWSHVRCTQYARSSRNLLEGQEDSRKRFMCLRCTDKLTLPISSSANMTDSDSDDAHHEAHDEADKNRADGDDLRLSVQIPSLHSILCRMEKKRVVKKESKAGDDNSGESVSRPPLSPDEVEARVENIETLRSGICRPSTGKRERSLLDLLTRQRQACS